MKINEALIARTSDISLDDSSVKPDFKKFNFICFNLTSSSAYGGH